MRQTISCSISFRQIEVGVGSRKALVASQDFARRPPYRFNTFGGAGLPEFVVVKFLFRHAMNEASQTFAPMQDAFQQLSERSAAFLHQSARRSASIRAVAAGPNSPGV